MLWWKLLRLRAAVSKGNSGDKTLEALQRIGNPAVKMLLTGLRADDARNSHFANALIALGEDVLPAVIEALQNPSQQGKDVLVKVAHQLAGGRVLSILGSLANHCDGVVRCEAIRRLADIEATRSTKTLIKLLVHHDPT